MGKELGHVEPGDYTLGWRYSATSVPMRERRTAWTIAPNPASGITWVIADHKPAPGTRIALHDLRGQKVSENPCVGKRTMLTVDSLASGNYVVGVITSEDPFRYIGQLHVLNDR